MKVWLVTFAILFALAEFYQWLKGFTFPLPFAILGGAFLAIASNYEKGICSFASQDPENLDYPAEQTATLVEDYPQLTEINPQDNSN